MQARIFQEAKNAMQSGRARMQGWVLEFAPAQARHPDPLMGWAGSGDTQAQVRLRFATLDAARVYADRHGVDAHVVATPQRSMKIQAYSDNFR